MWKQLFDYRGFIQRFGAVKATLLTTVLATFLAVLITFIINAFYPVENFSRAIYQSILTPLIIAPLIAYVFFNLLEKLDESELEKRKLISELNEALDKTKALNGMLAICSSCKKIRDDEGYWHKVENYIRDNSEADFTHGVCPDCASNFRQSFKK